MTVPQVLETLSVTEWLSSIVADGIGLKLKTFLQDSLENEMTPKGHCDTPFSI